jgi:hypothetical protein
MSMLPALLAAVGALCSIESAPRPAVVVQLFTSQGCSSCPPADRWLGSLHERYGDRVIPLSMHVGYWDYIGWKDPFARREFNERQRMLAAASGSSAVYTPGVFVQGREFPDWSRAGSLDAALRAAQTQTAAATLRVAVQHATPSSVTVHVEGSAPRGARLWLALVESGLTTAVQAGENRGATLHDNDVVRAWSGPHRAQDATVPMALPAGAPGDVGRWAVVALVEDEHGATLQAARLPLADCVARNARH